MDRKGFKLGTEAMIIIILTIIVLIFLLFIVKDKLTAILG